MRRLVVSALAALLMASPVWADPADEVLSLYRDFAAAQNRHEPAAVRDLLSSSPDFLWISDGRPYWGRDAMIARMSEFQKAEVWRVEPEYAAARVVTLAPDVAYLHMPLVLVIGSKAEPAKLRWLVEVLCRKTEEGWRIAALLTTQDKRP